MSQSSALHVLAAIATGWNHQQSIYIYIYIYISLLILFCEKCYSSTTDFYTCSVCTPKQVKKDSDDSLKCILHVLFRLLHGLRFYSHKLASRLIEAIWFFQFDVGHVKECKMARRARDFVLNQSIIAIATYKREGI